MAEIIDGKLIAEDVVATVKRLTAELAAKDHAAPGLAVVIVGEDPASQVYVSSKSKKAKECGFLSIQHTLPEETTQDELLTLVAKLNADPSIHGILVQLPLPLHLDSEPVIQSILPEKDVDGLHVVNAGKLATGDLETGLIPCTPAGSMILVERVRGKDLSGLNAVVIGRSNLFGKPMGQLLLASNATVIDVGINRVPAPEKGEGKHRLVGDVAFNEAANNAGAITPVPGGVGPMTIALLMANTLVSASLKAGLKRPTF